MNKKKVLLITIDTEADNQWDNSHKCTTNNTKYHIKAKRNLPN